MKEDVPLVSPIGSNLDVICAPISRNWQLSKVCWKRSRIPVNEPQNRREFFGVT